MKISDALKALIQESAQSDEYWVEQAKIDFATSLESRRRASLLSYKEVAARLKTSAAYISKVFRGDSNLTIESMVKLARATGGHLEVKVVEPKAAIASWGGAEALRVKRTLHIVASSQTIAASVRPEKTHCVEEDYFQFREAA